MDSLPCSLLNEILFRLDPKSLTMMQCTDRSINSYISDDPYFQSEYLSRVGSSFLHLSTFGSKALFGNPFYHSRSIRNKDPLELTSLILGSCAGLLLLFIDGLCVANPFTKFFRFIDHYNSRLLPDMIRHRYLRSPRFVLEWNKTNRIGFAVDQIDGTTQRFKIVCLSVLKDSDSGETMYQFEISTGDSCWRLSETTITCRSSYITLDHKPVYSNGSLHWLRNDGSILAFNPETEQAQLIPIKFPKKLSLTNLFAAAEKDLALVSARKEAIDVYALQNILTDPKWVLVKRIDENKEMMRYSNIAAYDGKCLMVRETKKYLHERVVHGYDLRANKWEVMCSMPEWCNTNCLKIYQFKPSFSSAIQLNKKMDVNMMTMGTVRMSSLSKLMRLVGEIQPYTQNLFKKKEKPLGESLRLMIEEETKLKKMEKTSSKFLAKKKKTSSKFMDVERINQRRRLK